MIYHFILCFCHSCHRHQGCSYLMAFPDATKPSSHWSYILMNAAWLQWSSLFCVYLCPFVTHSSGFLLQKLWNHLWPTSGESELYQKWVFFHTMSHFLWIVPTTNEFTNAIVSSTPKRQQCLCAVIRRRREQPLPLKRENLCWDARPWAAPKQYG